MSSPSVPSLCLLLRPTPTPTPTPLTRRPPRPRHRLTPRSPPKTTRVVPAPALSPPPTAAVPAWPTSRGRDHHLQTFSSTGPGVVPGVGIRDHQVCRRGKHPIPPAPAPADRPQRPQPPRRHQDHSLCRAMARNAHWAAEQPLAALLFREEEGDGGCQLSSCRLWALSPPMLSWCSLPRWSPCLCHSSWPHQSLWPQGSSWTSSVTWVAPWNPLAALVGFHQSWRPCCAPSGHVVNICSFNP